MSKSFKIQMNPTFKSAVQIPRVGGDPIAVTFTFKVLDRKSLARVFDAWKKENLQLIEDATSADKEGAPFTLEEWAEREITLQIKQIKDVVLGWGFDDEFNDENIEELLNSSISVTDAILEQYNDGYIKARQGN